MRKSGSFFPENMGESICIDETAPSNGELYTEYILLPDVRLLHSLRIAEDVCVRGIPQQNNPDKKPQMLKSGIDPLQHSRQLLLCAGKSYIFADVWFDLGTIAVYIQYFLLLIRNEYSSIKYTNHPIPQ